MDLLKNIWEFVDVVIVNGWGALAALTGAIQMAAKNRRKWFKKPKASAIAKKSLDWAKKIRPFYFGLAGVALSAFLAWQTERMAKEDAQSEAEYRAKRIERLSDNRHQTVVIPQVAEVNTQGGAIVSSNILQNSPGSNPVVNIGYQPRKLTAEQIQRLAKYLREHPVVGDLYFIFDSSAEDALPFARTITQGIIGGGVPVCERPSYETSSVPTFGVWVYCTPPAKDYSNILDALVDAGIDAKRGQPPRGGSIMSGGGPSIPGGSFIIWIGKRL